MELMSYCISNKPETCKTSINPILKWLKIHQY